MLYIILYLIFPPWLDSYLAYFETAVCNPIVLLRTIPNNPTPTKLHQQQISVCLNYLHTSLIPLLYLIHLDLILTIKVVDTKLLLNYYS